MKTLTILLIVFAVLGVRSDPPQNPYPDAEVIYRWNDHLIQFTRGLGFFAEFRELAHMYTGAWMAVACIQGQGTMPNGVVAATSCNGSPSASKHAAANAAMFNMWKISVQTRRNIFDSNVFFFNQTEQDNIIAISTTFYNSMKDFVKDVIKDNPPSINAGDAIGTSVSNWVWSIRQNDGHNKTTSNFVAKCPNPPCPAGVWWPYSANGKPPAPHWAELTLLCDDPVLFGGVNNREAIGIPPPPLPYGSSANASADQIFLYGNLTSAIRNQNQLMVGRWWQESGGFLYYNPVIRAINAGYPNLSLVQVLRALLHVSASTFDSNIIQYFHKLKYQSWRPWQRFNANLFNTGQVNGKTEFNLLFHPSGQQWLPQTMTFYPNSPTGARVPSPNHPDYPAGHPMSVGAWTRAFELAFPAAQGTNFASPAAYVNMPSIVDNATVFNLQYSNIAEITQEIIPARMYVGYHFTYASTVGMNSGRQVAEACFAKLSAFTGANPNYGTYGGVIPDPLQYHKRAASDETAGTF